MAIVGYIDLFTGSECAGWVIDEENPRDTLYVCLVVNGEEKHIEKADLERSDLAHRYTHTKHGFSFGIADLIGRGKNNLRIAVKGHDFVFRDDQITFDSRNSSSFVEIGENGWLFLQNDSNKTTDIIAGKSALADSAVDAIITRYEHISAYFASKNIKTVTYIIPEKGVLCNKFRSSPLRVSNQRPAMQLHKEAKTRNISTFIYGAEDLERLENPEEAYTKHDTHPSAIGQKAIFDCVLSRLDITFTGEITTEEIPAFSGDLGSKLIPPQAGMIKIFKPTYTTHDLVDEVTPAVNQGGMKLTGRRAFHRNENGAGTCVLLGTSTAYYMRDFFFSVFHETHYFWTAKISVSTVDVIRPDYVIFLATERTVSTNFMDNDVIFQPL